MSCFSRDRATESDWVPPCWVIFWPKSGCQTVITPCRSAVYRPVCRVPPIWTLISTPSFSIEPAPWHSRAANRRGVRDQGNTLIQFVPEWNSPPAAPRAAGSDLRRLHRLLEFLEGRHVLVGRHLAAGLDADLRRVAVQMRDQHRADHLVEFRFLLDHRLESRGERAGHAVGQQHT